MIIYIDKSIAEHGDITDEEEVMFTELACAHRRGECYLCGAPDSIDWLKNKLSIFCKGIGTQYAEMSTLINSVDTLVVISYNEIPILPQIIEQKMSRFNESVRIISVNQAIQYHLGRQCILLGESLYDCAFYRIITNRYMYLNRKTIRGVCLSIIDEIGGGDSTNKSLEKCVRINNNLTICLTDSDKKYDRTKKYGAEPSRGKTARDLESSAKVLVAEGLGKLFELYCLDVHEAENLIPFSVLDNIAQKSIKEMAPGIAYLRKLQAANLTGALLLYDFKNGNNIKKLREECQKPNSKKLPELAYWEEIAQLVGDESAPCLNEHVLSKSIECMNEPGYIYTDSFVVDSHLEETWNTIGKKIFSWGCANRPSSANPSH